MHFKLFCNNETSRRNFFKLAEYLDAMFLKLHLLKSYFDSSLYSSRPVKDEPEGNHIKNCTDKKVLCYNNKESEFVDDYYYTLKRVMS